MLIILHVVAPDLLSVSHLHPFIPLAFPLSHLHKLRRVALGHPDAIRQPRSTLTSRLQRVPDVIVDGGELVTDFLPVGSDVGDAAGGVLVVQGDVDHLGVVFLLAGAGIVLADVGVCVVRVEPCLGF